MPQINNGGDISKGRVKKQITFIHIDQGLSKHHKISSTPVRKVIFFCAAISHPLLAKIIKSETTFFQYFSPKIPKSKKFGHWNSGSGGKNMFKRNEQI